MVPRNRHSYSPIPGAGLPPRGLFIKRWGTLLLRPEKGYCESFADARFVPSVVDELFHAAQAGWNIYLIGNEDAVAFGHLPKATWDGFEADLLETLRSHGVPVTRCYACVDNPEGKKPHDRDSVFFLPNTGAMYHAAQMEGISLSHSWVIGDETIELVAGWRSGCHMAGVVSGNGFASEALQVEPEVIAADLSEVLRQIGSGEPLPR